MSEYTIFVIMIKNEKQIFNYIDIASYLVFIPLIVFLIPIDRLMEGDPYFVTVVIIYFFVIHFVNRKFSVVIYLLKRQYTQAAIVALIILAISYFLSTAKFKALAEFNENFTPQVLERMRIRTVWLLCFIDFCFTTILGLVTELSKQRIHRQNIEAEKNKAELALYKSQINPHFMFNTLNTLYGLFITNSEKTEEVFIKFTNLIKYMYANSEKDQIVISDEVNYIKEYIDIHALRLSNHTKVNFESEIDDNSAQIPPMIFITFIENAFKYGISSANESQIDISIVLKDNNVTFKTSNQVFANKEPSTGIGIENCRKRLELLYPKRYTLECKQANNKFETLLKMEL